MNGGEDIFSARPSGGGDAAEREAQRRRRDLREAVSRLAKNQNFRTWLYATLDDLRLFDRDESEVDGFGQGFRYAAHRIANRLLDAAEGVELMAQLYTIFAFLLNSSGAIILFVYLLISISQIVLRYRTPDSELPASCMPCSPYWSWRHCGFRYSTPSPQDASHDPPDWRSGTVRHYLSGSAPTATVLLETRLCSNCL